MKFGKVELKNSTASKLIESDSNNVLKGDRDISSSSSGNDDDVLDRTAISAIFATPALHAASHEVGGTDLMNVVGLNGLLAEGQTPIIHATSHEDGGSDVMSVQNLVGYLAWPQTPANHNNTYHTETYIEADGVTYENLNADGDVGTTANTVAAGDDSRFSSTSPTYAQITGGTTATTFSGGVQLQAEFNHNGNNVGATADQANDQIIINSSGTQ